MTNGTTNAPTVGMEKRMSGVINDTATAGFTSGVSSFGSGFSSGVSWAGNAKGSVTTGIISSNGGTVLMTISPRRAPSTPIRRNSAQIEFMHASLRFGSSFAAGRQCRASSLRNL